MEYMDMDIQAVKEKLAEMSSLVANMYLDALKSLNAHDEALAQSVIGRDTRADQLELEIDEMCLRFLARYSPKASELRFVVAILRLIVELERVGDHSKVMARQVAKRHLAPMLKALPEFQEISILPYQMLNEAMDAFLSGDAARYEVIIKTDETVGTLQNSLNESLVNLIKRDTSRTGPAISLINILRRQERIADHAKNIAELVPYVMSGEVVKGRALA
ncbi:MAG: phosphate signaling complex protein PhoU [Deltaproteobacteria bacterium]|jgi:phosphate transport system protein|nr:phosphate signaling complex protein PhoU [Deltaproteobacteria bacterium]